MKKLNLIIDTDPGVDDCVALTLALFEEKLNILLFSVVAGNVERDLSAKNLLHLLEVCNKKIPVVKGAEKPLSREYSSARYIHGERGTGNYYIKEPKLKPLKKDAIEAMYSKIKQFKGNITVVLLGPQTNMALLLQKHPDVKQMISKIIYMGACNYESKIMPNHISFNIKSDPEAFKIVLESGIPLVMIPSDIGRGSSLFEKEVEKIRTNSKIRTMLYEMLSGYWEPGFEIKRVAMNDSCAIFYLTHPELFKTKKADINLNLTDNPGKTIFKFNKNGNVHVVVKINVKKFHKLFFKKLEKIEKKEKEQI